VLLAILAGSSAGSHLYIRSFDFFTEV
jgi:hypothetical protein